MNKIANSRIWNKNNNKIEIAPMTVATTLGQPGGQKIDLEEVVLSNGQTLQSVLLNKV